MKIHNNSASYFILYAKTPDSKRFHPMDWSSGAVVINRIRATMFSAIEASKIRADIPALELANAGWLFELRSTQ